MKNVYILCLLFVSSLLSSTVVRAEGESRSQAIEVAQAGTWTLDGVKEANTTTWFKLLPSALEEGDMVSVQIAGGNFGDIEIYIDDERISFLMIGATNKNPLVKQYWSEGIESMYVAVTQDGPEGTATFSFSQARPGEVKEKAIPATEGTNTLSSDFAPVWYSYTSAADKVYFLSSSNVSLSDAVGAESGLMVCPASLLNVEGFRLREGDGVYFRSLSTKGSFTLSSKDIEPGMFSDIPLDISTLNSFKVSIPGDPNASDEGSAQMERYWLYNASKSGVLMWGTDDAKWMEGMWGVSVLDQTDNRRLSTPLTRVESGMLTYQINVEAGHSYLIGQVLGCSKTARSVTVRVAQSDGVEGDTKENPIQLTLNNVIDLGRKAANTKYYSFNALQSGCYTATIHAGGQVRATTPKDGTWTIARDYNIQDRHMHVDKEIELASGETLLLEITLTSDIDFHADGSDADIPNYSILITKNAEGGEVVTREGEDVEHAIVAYEDTTYPLYQSSEDDYYDRYYRVSLPAGMQLKIVTQHAAAASSPSPINFTLNGKSWNDVKYMSTPLSDEAGKKVGREYLVEPAEEDRIIFVETDGVSFLYEGAVWSYQIVGNETSIHVVESANVNQPIYNLTGQRVTDLTKKGAYIVGGKKIFIKK